MNVWRCNNKKCLKTFHIYARKIVDTPANPPYDKGFRCEIPCCPFCYSVDFVQCVGLTVNKLHSDNYPLMFDSYVPIRWFFVEGGKFDGVEVNVEELSPRDQKLIVELMDALAKANILSNQEEP